MGLSGPFPLNHILVLSTANPHDEKNLKGSKVPKFNPCLEKLTFRSIMDMLWEDARRLFPFLSFPRSSSIYSMGCDLSYEQVYSFHTP